MTDKPVVLIPGRWQPWHRGHQMLVEEVKEWATVIIGIRDYDPEPFSIFERFRIIRAALPGVDVVTLSSNPDDWRRTAKFAIVVTGNTETFKELVGFGYSTQLVPRHGDFTATELRKRLARGQPITDLVVPETEALIWHFWTRFEEDEAYARAIDPA